MKYISWSLCCLLLLVLFAFPLQMEAAEEALPTAKLQQEMENLKAGQQVSKEIMEEVSKYREYLQTESSKMLENLQKTQDNLLTLFTILVSIVTLLVPLAALGFSYLYGQSKKEHKAEIAQISQKLASEYEDKMKNKLKELEANFDQRLMAFLKEEEMQVAVLKQSITNERTYRSTRILVTGRKDAELKRMEQQELNYIGQRLIEKPKTMEYNERPIFTALEKGQVDILIYRYEQDEFDDDTLKRIVQLLIEKNYQIPFIVYTYQRENFNPDMKQALDQYFFNTLANYPTTLIGHIFSLGYAFNRETKK